MEQNHTFELGVKEAACSAMELSKQLSVLGSGKNFSEPVQKSRVLWKAHLAFQSILKAGKKMTLCSLNNKSWQAY